MSYMARAFTEQKSNAFYERWTEMLFGTSASKAGPSVTLDSAFQVSAAFACMRAIANGMSQVPFKLFQETEVNGLPAISRAKDHHLYDKLGVKPNEWSTSFEFRETLAMHVCMGNCYVFKSMARGKLLELIILDPGRVEVSQNPDWSINYRITGADGKVVDMGADKIWHIRGPSWDGFTGLDTLRIAKEAIGLSIASENSHSSFHANSLRPSGIYSVDGSLNPAQHKQLSDWIKGQAGAATAGTPLVLDRNAKWLSQSMSGIDAQHLETRKHQIEEVCRFFGINPAMIGHGDKAPTFASAEEQEKSHVVRGLGPWYARIENSADVNLLTDKERAQGYYFKFVVSGLLRGNTKDTAEYFAKALGAGGSPAWMTQDEVRKLDELNPFGGESAKLPPMIGRADPGKATQ